MNFFKRQPENAGTIISLPPNVYEHNFTQLILKLNVGHSAEQITLDFAKVSYYTPAGLIALLCAVHHWLRRGKRVFFRNHKTCGAYKYFQRIDFFTTLQLPLEENFVRHPSTAKFVPISRIARGGDTGQLASQMAECIVPELANSDNPEESGPFDLIQYAISELANNVVQHSGSDGHCLAQHARSSNITRIAIADHGVGIRESFRRCNSPFFREDMSDADAIETALRPQVSSKTHLSSGWGGEPVNAGVGLTLLKEIAAESDGELWIASGTGLVSIKDKRLTKRDLGTSGNVSGTLCAFSFNRSKVNNFFDVLQKAKQSVGLLGRVEFGNLFK